MARVRKQKPGAKLTAISTSNPRIKWQICVYIRLSKEDTKDIARRAENEHQLRSESIKNQESILTTWIEQYFEGEDFEIAAFFSDDGLTGTDDTREGFMDMLRVIEKGQGNCVVVKTLSRAFRNYSDQGYYLEEYFPYRNVRFISTMDSFVDSYTDPEAIYNLDVPMYGVMNDRYAGTTSRAVRRTFDDKRSKGKFIGAFPPWGFLKDPEDKNQLILDPDTAPIKLQVKDWLLHEDMSLAGAAKRLNALGIPNPTKYKRLKGWKYQNPHARSNDGLWTGATLKRELLSLMNLGHMVQGKQKVMSYKIHDKVAVPEEDWYIVEDTHEATFTQEDYDALRALLIRDTRTANKESVVHLFSGFIKCMDCKKAMQRSHGKGRVYYKCRTRGEKSKEACTIHSIREDKLAEAVLAAIQAQIELVESLAAIVDEINEAPAADNRSQRLDKLLSDKSRELGNAQNVYDSLYGDWKLGELTEQKYRRMRETYRAKIDFLESAVTNVKEEQQRLGDGVTKQSPMFTEFLRHKNIQELNRPALISLVDIIYVHEKKEITIQFLYEDEFLRILEFTEQNSGGEKRV